MSFKALCVLERTSKGLAKGFKSLPEAFEKLLKGIVKHMYKAIKNSLQGLQSNC